MDLITTGGGREALEAQLKQVNGAVGNAHPYVGGQEPNAWDVALAPRLYLARVGCRALKDWDFAQDYDNVKTYLHRWMGRQAWRNMASWDDESIVEELKAKVAKVQEK
jgi:glutathione S-transferase